jgi:hypothetical protein
MSRRFSELVLKPDSGTPAKRKKEIWPELSALMDSSKGEDSPSSGEEHGTNNGKKGTTDTAIATTSALPHGSALSPMESLFGNFNSSSNTTNAPTTTPTTTSALNPPSTTTTTNANINNNINNTNQLQDLATLLGGLSPDVVRVLNTLLGGCEKPQLESSIKKLELDMKTLWKPPADKFDGDAKELSQWIYHWVNYFAGAGVDDFSMQL